MRFYARLLVVVLCILFTLCSVVGPVAAQTITQIPTPQTTASMSAYEQFRTPNVDSSVPRNSHMYTQSVMIDVFSAFICQLSGIDPTQPNVPCLGINTKTGKIGMAPSGTDQTAPGTPQVGGALGLASNLVGGVYVQSVSSYQYIHYLADNFGIVKNAYAAPIPAATGTTDCSTFKFGYGFCGLTPIFNMWKALRDASYGFLTLIFIGLGIGVMVRFKVDPRTVMTLQNQIPRVVVSILLITFSYAIAGAMIDLMWTVTYAGITIISNAAPNSTIAISCANDGFSQQKPTNIQPISSVTQMLVNQPVSFANTLFLRDCNSTTNGGINGGILNISARISDSVRGLVNSILNSLFGWHTENLNCGIVTGSVKDCFVEFGLWITQLVVIAIIVVAILISLFRLWFQLIKTYITILIFVIMGPIWIIFGLIPGRPLGFEKWIRIMFANLAAYPLVAFILVFGRVMIDSVPPNPQPQAVFIPPLIGNPNVAAFSVFIGFGAILMAPTIPDLIKERMKAKGSGNYGKTVAAGLGVAAGIATNPGKKVWESLNHKNPTTGSPEGALAVMKQRAWQKTPVFGRRAIAKKQVLAEAHRTGDYTGLRQKKKELRPQLKTAQMKQKAETLDRKLNKPTLVNKATNLALRERRESRFNKLIPEIKKREDESSTQISSREQRLPWLQKPPQTSAGPQPEQPGGKAEESSGDQGGQPTDETS